MVETDKIRKFVKTDWYAFAGAERFDNGMDPYIYEKTMNDEAVWLTLIADKNGLELMLTELVDDESSIKLEDDEIWHKEIHLSPMRAKGYMRAIVEALEEYTYAPDLAYALDHCPKQKALEGFEYIG